MLSLVQQKVVHWWVKYILPTYVENFVPANVCLSRSPPLKYQQQHAYCYDFKFIAVINSTWAVPKESLEKSRLERELNPWPLRLNCKAH